MSHPSRLCAAERGGGRPVASCHRTIAIATHSQLCFFGPSSGGERMTIDKAEIWNETQTLPLTRRIARLAGIAFATAGIAIGFGDHGAWAAPPPVQMPTDESLQSDATTGPFGFLSDLPRSNLMLGDMWGLRKELSQYGISFAIQETS